MLVSVEIYTLYLLSSGTFEVSMGLRACMPSISNTLPSPSCKRLPLYSRLPVVKLNSGILAAQQVEQIALHGFAVHGLDVVEIILAVGELGCILSIDEIIVGRKR